MADRYYDRDDRDRDSRYSEAGVRGTDRDRNRDPHRDESRYGRGHDRDLMDRAGDEVRSWFGDDDAAHRREMDERRHESERGWGEPRGDQSWRSDRRPANGWSTRDSVPRGSSLSGGAESREWATRERDYGARGGPRSGSWRTSGRGRDHGDEDRSWIGSGPDWGREFGWGNEQRREPGHGGWRSDSYWSGGPGEAGGRFAGKGPRGYQRSDERIREDVCDRLTAHGDLDASNIEVETMNCEVTLRGVADSRFARRMAEDIAESVQGVKHVQNEIRVGQATDASGTGGAGGGMNAGSGGTAGAGLDRDQASRNREKVR